MNLGYIRRLTDEKYWHMFVGYTSLMNICIGWYRPTPHTHVL
jgi:hypothetical protein